MKTNYKSYANINTKQLNLNMTSLRSQSFQLYREATLYLKTCERYQLDYLFKLIVDTHDISYFFSIGNYDEYKNELDDLLNKLEQINKKEDFITNYFILANAYSDINKIDKAIFCYMRVIELGRKKDHFFVATSYYNIGDLYHIYNNYEKALEYMHKSRQFISELPNEDTRNNLFWTHTICEIATTYHELGNKEKYLEYYNLCQNNITDELAKARAVVYNKIIIIYHYLQGDFKSVDAVYHETLHYLKETEHYPDIIDYTIDYYKYAKDLNADLTKVIETITSVAKETRGKGRYKAETELLEIIIDYYIENNDLIAAADYIEALNELVSNYDKLTIEQNKKIMQINFKKQGFIDDERKTKELQKKKKAEHKNLIAKNKSITMLYARLKTIEDIVQNITYTDTIEETANSILTKLKPIVDIDNLTLLNFNDKRTNLKTCFIYDNNEKNTNYKIKLEPQNTELMQFIEAGELLKINDCQKEGAHKELLEQLKIDSTIYRSALIVPLTFQQTTIAIIFCLAHKKDAYKEIIPESIKQISTFISIAINNIHRKEKLIKTIKKQKQTTIKLEQLNSELEKFSQIDSLTKVSNRRAFDNFYHNKLQKMITKAQSVSIYMFDIDYFKNYNDHFGHLQGDDILRKVALTLSEYFQEKNQIFARYGGEEFIAFTSFKNDKDGKKAFEKAEMLRKAIEDLNINHPYSNYDKLTISIGVASITKPTVNSKEYVSLSDQALYQAKANGRNCVSQIIE